MLFRSLREKNTKHQATCNALKAKGYDCADSKFATVCSYYQKLYGSSSSATQAATAALGGASSSSSSSSRGNAIVEDDDTSSEHGGGLFHLNRRKVYRYEKYYAPHANLMTLEDICDMHRRNALALQGRGRGDYGFERDGEECVTSADVKEVLDALDEERYDKYRAEEKLRRTWRYDDICDCSDRKSVV